MILFDLIMQNIQLAIFPNYTYLPWHSQEHFISNFQSFRLYTCGMNSFWRLWENSSAKVREFCLSAD